MNKARERKREKEGKWKGEGEGETKRMEKGKERELQHLSFPGTGIDRMSKNFLGKNVFGVSK